MEIGCGLVQLAHSYDLNEMYGETYGYRSGLNESMVRHLAEKVTDILERGWLKDGDIVLDIGSNDGTTLGHFPREQFRLIGIDPSAAKFSEYYRDDIVQVPDFFAAEKFDTLFPDEKAKLVTSFSMFYDLEAPVAFAQDVSTILAQDGVWCFEQSYMPAMLAANSFDTICHEHLEYYSLTQIVDILGRVGLKLLDVNFNDVNGGSFSVYCGKIDGPHEANSEVIDAILNEEGAARYDTDAPFDAFKSRVAEQRAAVMAFLKKARDEGKTVVGLGASTKGNVLLQYYGITSDLLSCIAEVNPDKFGCFTPGTLIPIRDQKEVLAEKPDYLFVLPWHFRGFFEQLPVLAGHTLVFPLPELDIVTAGT
tara:strand:+ start:10496 stop:11590 length:1095 start_codon:yes stop_codon:yes gene_type:complete